MRKHISGLAVGDFVGGRWLLRMLTVVVLMTWGCTQSVQAQGFFQDVLNAVGEALGGKAEGEHARVRKAGEMPVEKPVELVVDGEFANEFTPALKQVLTVEIYFVRKVCNPSAEQLAELREVGKLQVAQIAKAFADAQAKGQATADWPDARKLITTAFAELVAEQISAEVANKYREEIAGRQAAQDAAARGMIINILDTRVSLSAEQATKVDATIQQNWQPKWSRNLMVYAYEQYAPLPDANLLSEHLDESQNRLLNHPNNHGSISFGWAVDLGLTPWENLGFGGQLTPLEEWTGPETQPEAK